MTTIKCSKSDTCFAKPDKCAICNAKADIFENYPCYEPREMAEVKHGEWVAYETEDTYGSDDSKTWYKCSECGKDAHGRCPEDEWYSYPIQSPYCPNCGAKMDGKRKEK